MGYLLAWLCPPLGYLAEGMIGPAFASILWIVAIVLMGMVFPPLWILLVFLTIHTYITIGRERARRRDERMARLIRSRS